MDRFLSLRELISILSESKKNAKRVIFYLTSFLFYTINLKI